MDKNIEIRPEVVEDNVKGYAPLDLDDCSDISSLGIIPENAKKVLGDIILCEVIDENEHGEILRGNIWIKENLGTKTWRKGKVIKMGKNVKKSKLEILLFILLIKV